MMASASNLSKKRKSISDLSDDLLIVILLLLPAKSILRFRCVAKRWNDVISTKFFLECYRRKMKELRRLPAFVRSLMVDACGPSTLIATSLVNHDYRIDFPEMKGSFRTWSFFMNSCNGLILLACYKYKNNDKFYQCRVLNPLTGRSVTLPDQPAINSIEGLLCMALVCDEYTEDLVASYKVVVTEAEGKAANSLAFATYSSKTGDWTSSSLMVKGGEVKLLERPPLVVNGIIYWHGFDSDCLVVYDSNRGHVQVIKLPYAGAWNYSIASSGGDDDLLYGVNNEGCLEIWTLPKGESVRWILKYSTTVDETSISWFKLYRDVDIIRVEALIPWKPNVAIISTSRCILLYDIERNSVEEVQYHQFMIRGGSRLNFPYMEPSCLSLYAL